jgi:hypothetical protein
LQSEFGEIGETINREVGAYLFERALSFSLGYGANSFGNFTVSGELYDKSMRNLLYFNNFNQDFYSKALNSFFEGSNVNSNGRYNSYILKSNDTNPVIKTLFPLK